MIKKESFIQKGFRQITRPLLIKSTNRDIRTEDIWVQRISDLLYIEIDIHGFVDLSRRNELVMGTKSHKNQHDRITLPKPVRSMKELNNLVTVMVGYS